MQQKIQLLADYLRILNYQWVKEHLSIVPFILQSKRSEFTFINSFLFCFLQVLVWKRAREIHWLHLPRASDSCSPGKCFYVGGRTLPSLRERKFDLSRSTSAFMENKTQTRPNIFRCSLKWPQQITLQELKWFGFWLFLWVWDILASSLCSAVYLGSRFWEVWGKNVPSQGLHYNICSSTWGSWKLQQSITHIN